MTSAHGPAVLSIYQAGLDTGNASFETAAPDWAGWDAVHLPAHRFVALDGGEVLGWVAVTPVSSRRAYAGVVEHSVYVAPGAHGRGVGATLLAAPVPSPQAAGIWVI